MDPFIQPLEAPEWDGRGEKLSVHLPYLFVTMGRSCLLGSMSRKREEKFVAGGGCRFECRGHSIEFELPDPGGNGNGKRLLELGNAFYHAVSMPVIERTIAIIHSRRNADRIVLTVPVAGAGGG
jgi:hypothetical protein